MREAGFSLFVVCFTASFLKKAAFEPANSLRDTVSYHLESTLNFSLEPCASGRGMLSLAVVLVYRYMHPIDRLATPACLFNNI